MIEHRHTRRSIATKIGNLAEQAKNQKKKKKQETKDITD